MRIAFLDESTMVLNNDVDFSGFATLGEYVAWPVTAPSEVTQHAGDCEVLVVNKVWLGKAEIDALPNLKHIAVIATGTNNVDLDAARARRIRVTNVGGYGRYTVPQHAFALILALTGRVVDYHRDVTAGDWDGSASFTLLRYPTFELAGKTLGVIGFGAIGRGVARIAESFGMEVRACNRSDFEHPLYDNEPLDSVLAASDVVTIHAPLTEVTRNLIDERELGLMKRGALIVNTGRGGIINEEALLKALQSGQIGGAGLDVLETEPPKGNPLVGRTDLNVIITPHSAWSAVEARQRLIDGVVANIRAWRNGADRNVVA